MIIQIHHIINVLKNRARNLLNLDDIGLLYRDDIKNMQGKEQRNEIYKYLKNSLLREVPEQDEYKF
jgi:DNA sulfur modification protein DndB